MWREAEGNTFNAMMSSIEHPDNKPQTASHTIARYPSISLTSSNDVFMEREKIAQLGQPGRLVIASELTVRPGETDLFTLSLSLPPSISVSAVRELI